MPSHTLLLAVLGLAGCIFKPNGSRVHHAAGQPVSSPNPLQWQSTSPEFAQKWLRLPPAAALLPPDHPAARRLQTWLDVIDSRLRQRHPEALRDVPKPQVLVVNSEVVNGFSFAVPICFQVKVQLPPPLPQEPPTYLMGVEFVPNEGRIRASQSALCAERTSDVSLLKRYIDVFNAQESRPEGCRMSFDGATVQFSGGCGRIPGGSQADTLQLPAVSNLIVIHTALLLSFSEEETVAAIGHELGHYYRAHALASPEHNGYFYRQQNLAGNSRPEPWSTPDLVRLTVELRSLGAIPFYSAPPQAAGQGADSIHRTVLAYTLLNPHASDITGSTLASRFPSVCGLRSECRQACQAIADVWQGVEARQSLLAREPWTPRQVELYRAVESSFAACARQVRLDGRGSPASMDRTILQGVLPPALLALESQPGAPVDSLWTDMKRYSDHAIRAEARYLALAREVASLQLGFYTSEQEADDFSIEILAALGIPPEAALGMMSRALRDHFTPVDPAAWPPERCFAARQAGWRENNAPATPPIGDWSAYHHSTCYRIFNMEREIRSHNYALAAAARPTFTDTWDSLRATLAPRGLLPNNPVNALFYLGAQKIHPIVPPKANAE